MTKPNKVIKTMTFTALSITALSFSTVSANDAPLVSTTIPASACQPANAEDAALLRLRNGAYMFNAEDTGSASLLCALPLNGWQAHFSLFHQNVDGADMDMSSYRVYYHDDAPCSSQSGVRVRLRYRRTTGGTSSNATPWWSSPEGPENGSFCFPPIDAGQHTTAEIGVDHQLRPNRLYHFLIQMRRESTNANPVFTGIDFPYQEVLPET